jgi:hypothetical protein
MTTIIAMVRQMPDGNEKEQTKRSLIAVLQKV